MKHLILTLAMVLAVALGAAARDKYSHDASVLPEAARTTIKNNFKSKVSLVKIDKEFGRIDEYEVILTDGSEITFDAKGNWKNVETNNSVSVPKGFIPAAVTEYVAKNHRGTKIVGIEKERHGYDVELSNSVDIKFDQSGKFIRYDD